MSTEIVKAEIKRFLASSDAEVLCITGKWGVGKTFAWMQYLSEAEKSNALGLDKYAYISLFGLNDLDALRYAIFESTVTTGHFLKGPDISSLRITLEKAGDFGRKSRPLFEPLLKAVGLGDAGEALSRAAFLSVRKQFVCLDDLERRGSALEIRDILGLVSMLKEQRQCKVILLLNDERLKPDDKDELQQQLEKVVDVSLVFEPSTEEAVAIAFADETPVNIKLAPKIVKLGITNIRVIKKIERLADRLELLLSTFRAEVLDHGIHAVALGGWLTLQPDSAPQMGFVKSYNSNLSSMRGKKDDVSEKEQNWGEVIERYGWSHCDELDLAIFDGVVAGYFDSEKLLTGAQSVQSSYDNDRENNSFSQAWRLYHNSFVIDDDVVLDAIYKGAQDNLSTISPLDLNATARLMREFTRADQADALIDQYVAQPNISADLLDNHLSMWGKEDVDQRLTDAFDRKKASFVDIRDPCEVLIKMTKNSGWNDEDIALLAKHNDKDFEKIFESIEGENLNSVVKFAISLGGHEGKNHQLIGSAGRGALGLIAAKSPLRKRRIANYGIKSNS